MPKKQFQLAPDFIPDGSPDFISDASTPGVGSPSTTTPQEQPGFFTRLAQSVGIPTSEKELESAKSQFEGPTGLLRAFNPGVAAVYDYGKSVVDNASDAAHEALEAGENIGEGGPVLPNLGKAAYGATRAGIRSIPFIGPAAENVGEDIAQKNYSGAAGGAMGVLLQAAAPEMLEKGAPALKKFALAPSDPDALYQSYLKPISGAPMPVPKAPRPVMNSVLRDMEAAGEGDAAGRIQSGKATVGDLDLMRQRANRLARSIYRSPGNYSPGMAEGADQLASDIRSQTYPLIESSQDLPAGSVSKIKTLQGKVMESQRNPTFTNRLITKTLGAGGGAGVGYAAGGPPGAFIGGALGERMAEPFADAVDKGITGIRTKALAYKLPEPGLVRRFALPASRMMPPVESAPGAPDFTEFTNPFTTQQLKNFILPEKSGAPIILDGTDEMTPGEKVAAQDFNLRKKRVLQLPEKGNPILLPSGQ